MEYVYFGEEFGRAAPELFGQLTEAPVMKWVTLVDVAKTIERGESVYVRPASTSEINRANKMLAMFQIAQQLGGAMADLLDAHGIEQPEIAATITRFRETVEDMKAPTLNVLDQEVPHGTA